MIPDWLEQPQDYTPQKDRDVFLRRNALQLTSMLSRVKMQRGGLDDDSLSVLDRLLICVDPALRIAGIILVILLNAASTNMFFTYCVAAGVLGILALKRGEDIVDVIKPALGGAAFTALIMLPAVFLGQPQSMVRITLKVFLSVVLLANLARGVAWNELVAGLRFYHVPSIFVFIFDITIKYIVLLGETAQSVLEALALRSVGSNRDKSGSASAVMGVTFLKAQDYAREMYQAMECRGFVGDYLSPRHRVFNPTGIAYLLVMAALVVWFFYLEGTM